MQVSKMPTLRFTDDQIYTRCNTGRELAPFIKGWQRCFPANDLRVPEGWDNSFELDGRMITLSFVRFDNTTKIAPGKYIAVHCIVSRSEALGQESKGTTVNGKTWFILPIMAVLKPQQEIGERLNADQYLEQAALCKFTDQQLEGWRQTKKLRVI